MNERPGEPIEGSRFIRAYCVRCNAPMRVPEYDKEKEYWCEQCSPGQAEPPGTGLTYRQRVGSAKTK